MKTFMMLIWVLSLAMTLGSVAYATDDDGTGEPKRFNHVTDGFFDDGSDN